MFRWGGGLHPLTRQPGPHHVRLVHFRPPVETGLVDREVGARDAHGVAATPSSRPPTVGGRCAPGPPAGARSPSVPGPPPRRRGGAVGRGLTARQTPGSGARAPCTAPTVPGPRALAGFS